MNRGWKIALAVLMAVILLLTGILLTVTHWLPRLAGFWLPADTTIALDGNPRWHHGALWLPGVHYRAGECELADVKGVALAYHQGRWQLAADAVTVDTACAANIPGSETQDAPRTLAEWQQMLPAANVTVHQLTIAPWQSWAGELRLNLDPLRQHLYYQGKNLSLNAELNGQQLTVTSLSAQAPGVPEPVSLSGTLTLPRIPDALPEAGALQGDLALDAVPDPLHFRLEWQQQNGTLAVTSKEHPEPLLTIPWDITREEIVVQKGQWSWPWATQPLSGGFTLSAKGWMQGLPATELSGRFNMLTQGRGGKGNVVLTLGPGHLDWLNSELPFRLTGESKLDTLQFFAGLPGDLRGPLLDPQIVMRPGALLRMKGRLLTSLEVDEARWPLAGVSLSSAGIDGRLQAILSVHDKDMGRFRLHLDGRASDFWPDKGQWLWRYWGDGFLAPLAAKWDVKGHGHWQDRLIELTSLSTGFDQLAYGNVTMNAPRLTLEQPVRWQRDPQTPSFTGQLSLKAKETRFSSGGYLPPSTLTLAVKGQDPEAFLYKGSLQAQKIGPVQVLGRWDGERLRGQMWWPEQPLNVFQPLVNPELKLAIQGGTLKAQVAFSAASDQGLKAGGHWLVSNGNVLLPDNEFTGVDFSLPFRLEAHRWYLGSHGPVSLRIKEINNQFSMQNVTADLQGWYPWSDGQPLQLSNVSLELLGGQLSMASLQMPQTEAATIELKHLSLSELITTMKLKQLAMSGYINGALPLWLNNSHWLVKEGWIANSGPLTVRMDKDMADAISSNNIAAGAAIDWLRYMEISRSWATIDLDNLGVMNMTAKVDGTSRFSNRNQRVSLNYSQQENMFQLWRSLRFGDNLQSWVEQNATLPSQKENRDESPQ
ncbi:YdbH family protein [Erwinia sorbitola]|uniref:YdbH family protein n=1 Tax=Erwinia sorbitola TaxID=2681984 RepID=A0A6I6ELD7_9GAMM|nr:YdbH family protein [Erwinia sorbitola]QGU87451.1 YdbH family protein [Erwinia sorbitola]